MVEVIAENYLCVAALLEMIIKNEYTDSHITQYILANDMGIIVPRGYTQIVCNQIESDDEYEYGIKLDKIKLYECLSQYFNVEVDYIPVNQIHELSLVEVISEYLDGGYWIICGYSYGVLYNISELIDCGHVGLITAIDRFENIIMYDPGPKNPGVKVVKDENLYCAMRKRSGGLVVIKFIKDLR